MIYRSDSQYAIIALSINNGTLLVPQKSKYVYPSHQEFNELKTASVDQLMYVKEDLIIAQVSSAI